MRNNFVKITLTFFSAIFIFNIAIAQDYSTGIGLRLGTFQSGITIKHFIDEQNAVEGILGIGSEAFVVTGFFQRHAKAFDVENLNWFYGLGVHVGGVSNTKTNTNGLMLGGDAILGLDWQIPEVPISLTADLHPRLELLNGAFLGIEPALTIRYTF